MYAITRMTTAVPVAAMLALLPAVAGAQSEQPQTQQPGAQDTQQAQPAGSQPQQQQSGGGADPQAVRQHLSAAQQALSELVKLPATAQLPEGELRTAISTFIKDFNTFATAKADWRGKYKVVDDSLDRLLDLAKAPAAPTTTTPADPSAPAPAAGGGTPDPAILEKLQTVRTELNGFEEASGDPVFIVEAIEQILEESSSGGGGANIPADKVQEIRRQLDRIRKAAAG
ncbi:MAG TPA: hypothetical protein VF136_06510 [Methylomirabilota bacterium]